MRSTLEPIGKHIRLVDERNGSASIPPLLGVSIEKVFMPSVANTIGSNMANYKIIKRGQFACSLMQVRRDKKIPVALLREYEKAIVSPAYPVFEIIDEEQLLPEYLMMWMLRPEFDREACFYAVGGVRGSLEWEDFCNMELPVSPVEKQREIVKEYETVVGRIRLNERLSEKLDEAAQAIYKQWFVEFQFPMTAEYAQSIGKPELAGQPYKSSGGEMEYNEVLEQEIPKGWTAESLGALFDIQGGSQPPASEFRFEPREGYVRFIQIRDYGSDDHMTYIPESTRNKKCDEFDVMIARYGASLGRICYGIAGTYNVALTKVIPADPCVREFLRSFLMTDTFYNELQAIGDGKSAREGFSKDELKLLTVGFPGFNAAAVHDFSEVAESLLKYCFALKNEQRVMRALSLVLLARMSLVGGE